MLRWHTEVKIDGVHYRVKSTVKPTREVNLIRLSDRTARRLSRKEFYALVRQKRLVIVHK